LTGLYGRTGVSESRRPRHAFAEDFRKIGRRSSPDQYQRVVILTDNAPWHTGTPVTKVLADNPHRRVKRLPSSSPRLNVIEHFGKLLCRQRPTTAGPTPLPT
jgi:transposase